MLLNSDSEFKSISANLKDDNFFDFLIKTLRDTTHEDLSLMLNILALIFNYSSINEKEFDKSNGYQEILSKLSCEL